MGIELPSELAGVAAKAGVRWPEADEEAMKATAQAWRDAGGRLSALVSDADHTARGALEATRGEAGDAAARHWDGFVQPDTGHLTAAARGCTQAADRLEHAANQVGAAKVEIVRNLVALARNSDVAEQAAAAGHPTALAALDTAVKGTAANVANIHATLVRSVDPAAGVSVENVRDVVDVNPGSPGQPAQPGQHGLVADVVNGTANTVGAAGHIPAGLAQSAAHTVDAGLHTVGGAPQAVGGPVADVAQGLPAAPGPVGGSPFDPSPPQHGSGPGGPHGLPVPLPDPDSTGPVPVPGAGHAAPGTGPGFPGSGFLQPGSPAGPAVPLPHDAPTPPAGLPVAGHFGQTVQASAAGLLDPPVPGQAGAGYVPAPAGPPVGGPAGGASYGGGGFPGGPAGGPGFAPMAPPPAAAAPPAVGAGPAVGQPPAPGAPVPNSAGPNQAAANPAIPNQARGADRGAPVLFGPDQPRGPAADRIREPERRPEGFGGAAQPAPPPAANPAAKTERDKLVALFLVRMFPIGHLPVATSKPMRQLPAPRPEFDFAPGQRFEPHDHPDAALVDDAEALRRALDGGEPPASAPGRPADDPTVAELTSAYDPLGDQHERDWDRRFVVRAGEAGTGRGAEYAWPPGELYPEGGSAPGEPEVLAEGTLIDRFGSPEGRVFAPGGTAFANRSLPPSHVDAGYRRYRVLRPLPVWRAMSAAWFAQPGGGLRYRAVYPAIDLVALGYLADVTLADVTDEESTEPTTGTQR